MNPIIPVYYQIKETIKSWIINKEFNPGGKILSENELVEKFNVSRSTIRQAISQLIQEGFLNSKRGEGTFVTDDEKLISSFNFEFSGLMDDLFFHQISKIKVRSAKINRIIPSQMIKRRLELGDADREVIQIKRIRFLNERLVTYTINYLPMEIGTKITEKGLYEKPLLRILEQDLKIQFTEAVQTIEASFADQEVAENLGIVPGAPILFIERIMYGKRLKPVEIFQSSYRGDLNKFIVRFRNIKRKNMSKWVQRLN